MRIKVAISNNPYQGLSTGQALLSGFSVSKMLKREEAKKYFIIRTASKDRMAFTVL
jgi:hypothetical protein